MTGLIPLLIAVPFLIGLALLFAKPERIRRPILLTGVVLVMAGSVLLALRPEMSASLLAYPIPPERINEGMLVLEVAISLYLVWVGIRSRQWLIPLLVLAQAGLLLPLELSSGHGAVTTHDLFCDKFSIIMALIIGLVGGLICIYALDYMREFHERHHPELPDHRCRFFAILFLFLGAMFGVVFANNLLWLYFFWEITTLCSFWLIGYKGTEESLRNARRALVMNLAGGLAFAGAIYWQLRSGQPAELDGLLSSGASLALAPAVLLAFAGITKSAQLPFSSWLLGAMVAPTPVSALLHSSTMVNAGVYLVLRMSPVLHGTLAGTLVASVGGLTFLLTSLAAITTSDAKKVLAYSTIANLGLIVLCGGIGTPEAVWAGILLIVFHAIAKGLLFLCVGVVEHKLHSRDISDMSGLILKMPRISIMLQIGMAGMFLAPFGMLISKWAVLKAVVDTLPLLTFFIVFGSAATLFFWIKWMGTLLEVVAPHENVERNIGAGKWIALTTLAVLTFGTCMLFPLLSNALIVPFVTAQYHLAEFSAMKQGNIVIMIIMLALVSLFPLSFLNYGKHVKVVDPYLGGANTAQGNQFTGSAGAVHGMSMQGYHLSALFSEAKLMQAGVVLAGLLLAGLLLKVAWL
ncbi:MAG: NADH-quinone oxidoreductase subunit L [Kiritimatiellia bacterium]